jgi:hypothetical protein
MRSEPFFLQQKVLGWSSNQNTGQSGRSQNTPLQVLPKGWMFAKIGA